MFPCSSKLISLQIELPEETELDCVLKLKWKRKKYDFSEKELKELLDPIGKVHSVALSQKKKGSAIVVFKTVVDAVSSCKLSVGLILELMSCFFSMEL